MKILNLNVMVLASALFLFLSSCGNEKKTEAKDDVMQEEQTSTEVTPEVLFENDYAKVSRISLDPGDILPTQEGENRMIYALTDYTIDWEEKGAQIGARSWKKGDVHFHDAGTHAAKNNGTDLAEWLVFSRKENKLPDCGENSLDNDVISVSPDFAKTLFENNDFKITKVNLATGESIPMHSGINRVIYSLSDYKLKYESDTEGTIDKSFKTDEVHWHQACKHALENIGETEAEFLVVSFREKIM